MMVAVGGVRGLLQLASYYNQQSRRRESVSSFPQTATQLALPVRISVSETRRTITIKSNRLATQWHIQFPCLFKSIG